MSVTEWFNYLKSQSAQIDNDWLEHWQQPEQQQSGDERFQLCALTQLGCLEVKGEEAESFLHNQVSNDIRQLDNDNAQLAAYCSAKGRVISLFWIIKSGNSFRILLPRDRLEATAKRLRMFVLMSKVEINDVSDDWHCLGVFGAGSQDALALLSLAAPASTLAVSQTEKQLAIRCHGDKERYLIMLRDDIAPASWQTLAAKAHLASSRAWIAEDIAAGVPQVYQATSEAFVPQMINLHSLNAINFTKGCYPGQEVVARMKYLGKLKRRMFRAQVSAPLTPQPGEEIVDNEDKTVGEIVDVAPLNPENLNDGQYSLLAVLVIASSEQPLHLKSNGASLEIKDLPYDVELENTQ